MMNSEKGQTFTLALIALALGSLVIAPFLGHASSSLIGTRIHEQVITQLHSADAGVEYAIWHLQNGKLEVPEFTINSAPVNVTIQHESGQIFKITSTATSDDGSSVTIESFVSMVLTLSPGDFKVREDRTHTGDVYYEGNVELEDEATLNGRVYAGGNVLLKEEDATINGDVYAEGNVTLDEDATIIGQVCAWGNVELKDEDVTIDGEVYVAGNVILDEDCRIIGDVYVGGNVDHPNRITGNIYPYDGWPLLFIGSIYIQTWQIMRQ